MKTIAEKFSDDTEKKSFDLVHRVNIRSSLRKFDAAHQIGLDNYTNHELARTRASYIKVGALNNLENTLLEFEAKFTARGGKVIWARDAQEALSEVLKIVNQNQQLSKTIVKSKSMTTEEIHLNPILEKNGFEVLETDLGEYILQLDNQTPYHIVTPAMHLTREEIGRIFEKKLSVEFTSDPQELTMIARRILRQKYLEADIGISGGNFLIADIGAIAITENEGNARLCTSFPKLHISIVGLEKVLPSMADLDLYWQLLATHGTGQTMTVYNTILAGPRQPNEKDGPEQMYVILIDNGRTNLLADPVKRQALHCIRCGACLNVCPVYKNIGGHSYATTYSGPIGAVISPHLMGMKDYKHLSYASSLCGACTSVCPVKIDLHNLLLLNRKQAVEEGYNPKIEGQGFSVFSQAMRSRFFINFASAAIKNFFIKLLFKNTWSKHRANIQIAPKSFNTIWKERQNKK